VNVEDIIIRNVTCEPPPKVPGEFPLLRNRSSKHVDRQSGRQISGREATFRTIGIGGSNFAPHVRQLIERIHNFLDHGAWTAVTRRERGYDMKHFQIGHPGSNGAAFSQLFNCSVCTVILDTYHL
jgi:hypothetical protein